MARRSSGPDEKIIDEIREAPEEYPSGASISAEEIRSAGYSPERVEAIATRRPIIESVREPSSSPTPRRVERVTGRDVEIKKPILQRAKEFIGSIGKEEPTNGPAKKAGRGRAPRAPKLPKPPKMRLPRRVRMQRYARSYGSTGPLVRRLEAEDLMDGDVGLSPSDVLNLGMAELGSGGGLGDFGGLGNIDTAARGMMSGASFGTGDVGDIMNLGQDMLGSGSIFGRRGAAKKKRSR